ncbi:MAG TPA: hypothetical protein VEU08_01365 [Vicinamibacterales bacterium]|nr:hypothetical protein [Vicinamibacterales bacterium]
MTIRHAILTVCFLVIAVHTASAQSGDPYYTDLSVNYDVIYHETGDTSNAGAHVDFASTWKRDAPFLGPVGEIGFNHFTGGTVVDAMGGLRVRANTDYAVLPFAQVLVGLYHCGVCDINDFALQLGGGLDFRPGNPDFRVRVQFDYRRVFDSVAAFNAARVSVGIVVPLNK